MLYIFLMRCRDFSLEPPQSGLCPRIRHPYGVHHNQGIRDGVCSLCNNHYSPIFQNWHIAFMKLFFSGINLVKKTICHLSASCLGYSFTSAPMISDTLKPPNMRFNTKSFCYNSLKSIHKHKGHRWSNYTSSWSMSNIFMCRASHLESVHSLDSTFQLFFSRSLI